MSEKRHICVGDLIVSMGYLYVVVGDVWGESTHAMCCGFVWREGDRLPAWLTVSWVRADWNNRIAR